MFLVVVDAHSKWVEIEIVLSASSFHTINKLRSMFATLGLPKLLVSDNETGFTSSDFQELMWGNGIHNVTSPVSYTHLPSPRDRQKSRMPSSA